MHIIIWSVLYQRIFRLSWTITNRYHWIIKALVEFYESSIWASSEYQSTSQRSYFIKWAALQLTAVCMEGRMHGKQNAWKAECINVGYKSQPQLKLQLHYFAFQTHYFHFWCVTVIKRPYCCCLIMTRDTIIVKNQVKYNIRWNEKKLIVTTSILLTLIHMNSVIKVIKW